MNDVAAAATSNASASSAGAELTDVNPGLGFAATIAALRNASLCATCGKTRYVFNAERRGFRAEKVSPATHCACPDGPAFRPEPTP